MKLSRSVKNILIAIICVVIALIMGSLDTLQTYAEDLLAAPAVNEEAEEAAALEALNAASSDNQYVSEVILSTGNSASAAKKWLTDNGYNVVDQDLKCGQGGKYVYLGYKTTTDSSQAITDIRTANMSSGVKEYKYRDEKKQLQGKTKELITQLKETVSEVQTKASEGSPLAQAAIETLNVFYFESGNDHIPLFDYLKDSSRTTEDYENLVLIPVNDVVSTMLSTLAAGTADYTSSVGTGTNFAQRILSLEKVSDFYLQESTNRESYYENAKLIMPQLVYFASQYKKAKEYMNSLSDDEIKSIVNKINKSAETAQSGAADALSDGMDADTELTDREKQYYEYSTYIGAYELLSSESYTFSEPIEDLNDKSVTYKTVGDYILGCGDVADSENITEEEYNRAYAIAASLSSAQCYAIKYSGFSSFVSAINSNTAETLESMRTENAKIKETAAKDGYTDGIPVYIGADPDIYNKSVALTSDALRIQAADKNYTFLKTEKIDQLQENIKRAFLWATCVFTGTLAASLTLLTVALIAAKVAGCALTFTLASIGTMGTVAMLWLSGGMAAVTAEFASISTGAVACAVAGVAFLAVAIVAIVVIAIISIIMLIKRMKDDSKKVVKSSIPQLIYEYYNKEYIKYSAVNGTDGNPADVNAGQSDEWETLYVSTSTKVGGPIKAADLQSCIIGSTNSAVPDGYLPVRRFGSTSAANLNQYDSKPSKGVYLFYTPGETGEDYKEDSDAQKSGKYIMDMKLAVGDAAIDELRKGGFQVIETNLTNGNGYTYLGYKTTNNVSNAIRDIRVEYGTGEQKVKFGATATRDKNGAITSTTACNYTNCYNDAEDKKATSDFLTPNKWSLFYSTDEGAGEPILAKSLTLSATVLSESDGWVMANLFSGGPAFDLYNRDGRKSNDGSHLYLYYKYETNVMEMDVDYISGFAFTNSGDIQGDASYLGYTLTGFGTKDICEGASDHATCLMTYITHNKYKGISDVMSYTASCNAPSLPETIAVSSTIYFACETFARFSSKSSIRLTNSYLTKYEAESDSTQQEERDNVTNDQFTWSSIRQMGLYVAGPDGNTPLTTSDIIICNGQLGSGAYTYVDGSACGGKSETDASFRAVSDFTDAVGETETPANLAVNLNEVSAHTHSSGYSVWDTYTWDEYTLTNYAYMFVRGAKRTTGKYVQAIYCEYSDSKNFSNETAMLTLLSKHGYGKIIKKNILQSESDQAFQSDYAGGSCQKVAEQQKAAYVMVVYTNVKSKAMKDAVIYTQGKDTVQDVADFGYKFKYNSMKYYSSGSVLKSSNGDFAILYTDNTYGGDPVTDVVIDTQTMTEGYSTVLNCDWTLNSDNTGKSDSDKTDYPLTAYRTDPNYYIKLKREENTGAKSLYYYKIEEAVGATKEEALKLLYDAGCNQYIDKQLEEETSGSQLEYVYIGYRASSVKIAGMSPITGVTYAARTLEGGNEVYAKTVTEDYKDINDNYERKERTYSLAFTCSSFDSTLYNDTKVLYTTTDTSLNRIKEIRINADMLTDPAAELRLQSEDGWEQGSILAVKRDVDYTFSGGTLTINIDGKMPDYGNGKTYKASDGKTYTYNYKPAWSGCYRSATSVILTGNVTSIDAQAFSGFTKLKTITIRNRNCEIEEGAIPKGCKIIGYEDSSAQSYAKAAGNEFEYLIDFTEQCPDGLTIIASDRYAYIDGSGVLSGIPEDIYNSGNITMLIIGSGVTLVKKGTFDQNGFGFFEVTFEGTDTEIEEGAFPTDWDMKASAGSKAANYALAHNITLNGYNNTGGCINGSIYWSIEEGTLTIYGSGELKLDYSDAEQKAASWYEYRDQIKHVVISDGFTSIAEKTFAALRYCEDISIPESVTKLEENCLKGIFGTTPKVTVKNDECVFPSVLGASCYLIGGECSTAQKYAVDNNVTFTVIDRDYVTPELGIWDEGLLTLTYSGEMEHYGKYDYMSASSGLPGNYGRVRSIAIDSRATSIGSYAFNQYSQVTSVQFGTEYVDGKLQCALKYISEGAFAGCRQLSEIVIPDSVNGIGTDAFKNSGLKKITITNKNMRFIGDIGLPSDATIVCYMNSTADTYASEHNLAVQYINEFETSTPGSADAKAAIRGGKIFLSGKTISSISQYALDHDTSITEVVVEEDVEEIGSGCITDRFTKATFMSDTTKIDDNGVDTNVDIVAGENSLAAAYANSNGNTLNGVAPANSGNLKSGVKWMVSGSVLTVYGKGALQFADDTEKSANSLAAYKSGVTEVVVKEGVTSIDTYGLFAALRNVTRITLAGSVASICENAFVGFSNTSLEIVVNNDDCIFPENLGKSASITAAPGSTAEQYAVKKGLTFNSVQEGSTSDFTVDINEPEFTVVYDGEMTDRNEYIGRERMAKPIVSESQAQTITFSSGAENIAAYAFAVGKMSSVKFGENHDEGTFTPKIRYIGAYAFYHCTSLKELDIPECVQSIGEECFLESGVKTITIRNKNCRFIGDIGLDSGATVVCYEGSTAETYAKEHDLGVSYIGSEEPSSEETETTTQEAGSKTSEQSTAAAETTSETTAAVTQTTTETETVSEETTTAAETTAEETTEKADEEEIADITWECTRDDADENQLVLKITGKGRMPDYTEENPAPWYKQKDQVTKIVLDSDLTSVGAYAFYGFSLVTDVDFGFEEIRMSADTTKKQDISSVKSIGEYAFAGCTALESIIIPKATLKVADNSFDKCTALMDFKVSNPKCELADNLGIPEDAVITCPENSLAYEYANKNGYEVVIDNSLALTATILTKGSIWMIIIIVVILAALGAVMLIYKKRKAERK